MAVGRAATLKRMDLQQGTKRIGSLDLDTWVPWVDAAGAMVMRSPKGSTEGSLDRLKGYGPAALMPNVQFTEERESRHQALALALSPLQLVEDTWCDSPVFTDVNIEFPGVQRSAPSLRIGVSGVHQRAPGGAEEVEAFAPITPMHSPGGGGGGGGGVGLEGTSSLSLVIPEEDEGESALGGVWEETAAAAAAAGNGTDSGKPASEDLGGLGGRRRGGRARRTSAESAESEQVEGRGGVGGLHANATAAADDADKGRARRIMSATSFNTIFTRILNLGFESSGPPRVVASVIRLATSFNPF